MDHHHFLQLRLQQQQPQQQLQEQEQPKPLNLYDLDGVVSAPAVASYFNGAAAAFTNQSHPPYVPQFHVAGFSPGAAGAPEECHGYDVGNIQWDYEFEQKAERPREQDFLASNTHPSGVYFLQAPSVSTGLGLSLQNTDGLHSSADFHSLSIISDEIDREMQRQSAEMYRYLKIQGDQMREAILEKFQADQLRTISYIEAKLIQKLREKEAELENTYRKNIELEERIERLASEAAIWQERAKYSENMITLLKFNLQNLCAQSGDVKEWCGDSEVDDTSSCCEGHNTLDFRLHCKDSGALELMTCKLF